jgi:imidazolonepropionase-like amidohydrolase
VRDTGGADWGLKEATEKGLLQGPRLFIAGRALGPTGGHSDGRRRTDLGTRCQCCNALTFSMGIADGISEVRRAVREEMRQGCDQVKIMMSGGVASPYDPLDSLQFSMEEVAAAVEEAHAFGRYVCAHAYTPEAITRAAKAGVRTIEHGNLIDEPSAKLMAEKGMFLVANLVTYFEMKKRAAEYGMNAEMLAKNDLVIDGALKSLEICKRHGVPVAYGTDLLGPLQVAQSEEFTIRAQVLSPAEIIRSATIIGAQVVRMVDKLGCLKAGAFADLLVVDGNPLKDLKLLQGQGQHLSAIMKGGRFHKNRLH